MRIPLGDQGFAPVRVAPAARVPAVAFGADGEQLSRAGAELGQVADRQMQMEGFDARQKAAEQRQEERQAAREADAENRRLLQERMRQAAADARQAQANAVGAALAHFEGDISDVQRSVATQLAEGRINSDQALAELEKGTAAARARRFTADMDPRIVGAAEDNIVRSLNRAREGVLGVAMQRARSDREAGFGSTIEALERQALTDPAAAIARARDIFGSEGQQLYGPEGARQRLQRFEESVSRVQATSLVNNNPALAARQLKDNAFLPALDPMQRTSLLAAAEQKVFMAQQRAQAAGERIARENQQAFGAAAAIVQAGKVLDPEFAGQLAARFRGTPFAAGLQQLMSAAPAAQAFAAQPVAVQERALFDLQKKGNTTGWTPAEQRQYEDLNKTLEATRRDIREDPFKAGLERGVLPNVAPLSMNLQALPQQLAARVSQAQALEQWAGRPVSPFRPEEARQVSTMLAALQPRDRAEALSQLGATMTPAQMRATAEQFAGEAKSVALATATMLASQRRVTNRGRQVAELILTGDDLLRTKSVKIDANAETGARTAIRNELRGAFASTQAEDAAVEASFRVYAALKSEGRDDTSAAVRLTTGGVWEHNGTKTVRRYGWTDGDMRGAVEAQVPARINERAGGVLRAGDQALSADALYQQRRRWQLGSTARPGEYTVSVGNRMVTRADGSPFTVQLWSE